MHTQELSQIAKTNRGHKLLKVNGLSHNADWWKISQKLTYHNPKIGLWLVFTKRIKLILGLTVGVNLIQRFGGLTFGLKVGGAYFWKKEQK